MKRALLLGALLLLLAGCAAQTKTRENQTVITQPPIVETIKPEPDAGISSVKLQAPDAVALSADQPEAEIKVAFANVNPAGAPAEGRSCTLRFLRDGAELECRENFLLLEGSTVTFNMTYPFRRYMEEQTALLTVVLEYKQERVSKDIPLTLENWDDGVYAKLIGEEDPYYIEVLSNWNMVLVYGKDEEGEHTRLAKAFVCSTGWSTPSGTYSLNSRFEWRTMFGGVYAQYATIITGNILFHSVPYYTRSKDDLEYNEYNRLGTKASSGCIRLSVADAKWIYENCPAGTKVKIYNIQEDPPVEKPLPIVIDPESPYRGWDPTDPDPENPWHIVKSAAAQ